mmetsp:Transcript_54688/g.130627  ORF Transcript_54688/g.130627 Transcript_54688/m.130627 type:complete len:270 (-) Transcript_54688:1675-2484(-)
MKLLNRLVQEPKHLPRVQQRQQQICPEPSKAFSGTPSRAGQQLRKKDLHRSSRQGVQPLFPVRRASLAEGAVAPKLGSARGALHASVARVKLQAHVANLTFFCMLAQAHAPAWDSLARFPDVRVCESQLFEASARKGGTGIWAHPFPSEPHQFLVLNDVVAPNRHWRTVFLARRAIRTGLAHHACPTVLVGPVQARAAHIHDPGSVRAWRARLAAEACHHAAWGARIVLHEITQRGRRQRRRCAVRHAKVACEEHRRDGGPGRSHQNLT